MGCFSGGKWWCMSSRLLRGAGCTVGAARGGSTCWDESSYWPTPINPRASSSICEPFPVVRVRAYCGSRLESLADCLSIENMGECHANVTSFPWQWHFNFRTRMYDAQFACSSLLFHFGPKSVEFMLVFHSMLPATAISLFPFLSPFLFLFLYPGPRVAGPQAALLSSG